MAKKNIGKSFVLEETHAYTSVLLWFFAYPGKGVGLNDLSRAVNVSKTSVKNAVMMLQDEGFLTIEILGKIWWIRANPTHPYLLTRKMPYHLQLIYESGVLEEVRKNVPNPRAVVLFGSYRKGEDTERSDVDIAAEVVGDNEMEVRKIGMLKLGFRDNISVNLHIFSRKKIDINLFANVSNGIVLEGFLEV